MKKLLLILILVLFTLPAALVLTQDATPTPVFPLAITGVDATNLPEARITANVFDLFGQPLQGLDVGNFILTGELAEVAQIVSVENITDDNLPFASVLVIDVSSSMSGLPFQQAQEAARVFINSLRENDLVAIITFSNQAQLVQDYTIDKALLLATIDNLAFGGQTALYDAALTALDVAANAPVNRRAIIFLSDGAESDGRGGLISSNPREAAPQAALLRGVPLYTIGLGFGTDRTYLEALSNTTNALFSESPTPDQLPEIYGNLAALLRSQYVITLNADVPLDGTEYDFTLQATTANGDSTEATSVLRAPIPVPIVRFDNPPTGAINELTTVNALILADDQLTEIVIDDGVRPQNVIVVDTAGGAVGVDFDPATFAPGMYTLTISATDNNGDTGTDSLPIEIAALPSTVTIVPDLTGMTLSEPVDLVLIPGGQTAPTEVSVQFGEIQETLTDPYTFTIDPAQLEPGEQTLSITITNEGGVTSTTEQTFTVLAVPPQFTISGIEAGQVFEGSFLPGETFPVEINVISQTLITRVSVNNVNTSVQPDGSYTLNVPYGAAGNNTLEITVSNASGQTNNQSIPYTVILIPTPTPTPRPTITSTPMPTVDVRGTANAESSSTAQSIIVQATSDARITAQAQSTLDSQATLDTQAANEANAAASAEALAATTTAESQATANTQATNDANATASAEALAATTTAESQATANAQGTNESRATRNAQITEQAATEIGATRDADSTRVAQDMPRLTENAQSTRDARATTQANAQGTSTTEAILTEQAFSQQATRDVRITANAQSTAQGQLTATSDAQVRGTVQANFTATAEAALNLEASAVAGTIEGVTQTADALGTATGEANSAAVAQASTADSQGTRDAEPTATLEATATRDAEPTATLETTATRDAEPTATLEATAEPTEELTPTMGPTVTPVEITEVGAQNAPDQNQTDLLPFIVCGIGILVLLIILILVFARRRRE